MFRPMKALSSAGYGLASSAYFLALVVLAIRVGREWLEPGPEKTAPLDTEDRRLAWKLVAFAYLYSVLFFLSLYALLIALQGEYGFGFFVRGFSFWDGGRYLQLAGEGYAASGEDAKNIVFPPLYPAALALTSLAVPLARAPFVLNALLLAPLVLLFFRLARLDLDRLTACRATLLWIVVPLSHLRLATYSETLFSVLLLAAMYEARAGCWVRSGAASFAMALTRSTGYFVWPALAIEYVLGTRGREGRLRLRDRRHLYLLAVPAAALAYLGINFWLFGDPLAFLGYQKSIWNKQPASFLDGLATAVQPHGWEDLKALLTQRNAEATALLFAILMTLWSSLRLRPSYGIMMACCVFFFTSTTWVLSTPRYISVFFPIPMLLADGITRVGDRRGAPGISRVLLGLLLSIDVALALTYASWFVRAKWAF